MGDKKFDSKQLTQRGRAVIRNVRMRATEKGYQLAAAGAHIHPKMRAKHFGVEVLRDIPYRAGGSKDHLLDIYRPEGAGDNLPVVLYIHGGGFRMLSKETHWVMGQMFARAGYLVFVNNYRLAPKHQFPVGLSDTFDAYRWVVENAAAYGGDIDRLVVAGESAGANYTLNTVIATCFERPEPFAKPLYELGVVPKVAMPICGFLQVSDSARFARKKKLGRFVRTSLRDVPVDYIGKTPPQEAALADPLVVMETDAKPSRPLPPFFVAVGTKDPLLDDSRRLAAALSQRGIKHQMEYYPGELHAFHAFIWREHAKDCWEKILAFAGDNLATDAKASGKKKRAGSK